MLPQLSYIVAQAGVDSRPPPMLPRLTKPFQAIGIDSKPNGAFNTPSSTSGSNVDPSIYTPSSYYVRPGSSPSAPPPTPPLPIPSNTSSTLTSPSTDVVSTSSFSYAYPPSTTSGQAPSSKVTSSLVGPETGRSNTSSRLAATPQWQSLPKSPPPPPPSTIPTTNTTMGAKASSTYHDYTPPPAGVYNQQHQHHQQKHSQPSSSSTGYSQQSMYTSSSNLVYPTYQSNDQWTHRVTVPFVEPSKSSSSPPPPSSFNSNNNSNNNTYSSFTATTTASAYLPYTTTTQSPVQKVDHSSYSVLNSTSATSAITSVEQYHHEPHPLHQQQQKNPPKYPQHEDHHYHYHHHQQQQQQQSRGFTVPDNTIALNNDAVDDDEDAANNNNVNFHPPITNLSYGATTTTTTNSGYTTSHRVEHMNKWNQLLTRMDHEFWEQSQEIYQEKLSSLQHELKSLQNNTHVTFRESLSDLKIQRDAMIADAECFLYYEMEGTEQLYQKDIAAIEDDYNNERKHLHNAIMAAIEDRRRLIKEEKDHGLTTKDLFDEAYSRVTNKRTLRKRPAENSRQDSRKRQGRHAASHQFDSNTASKREEDELDDELLLMKMLPQSL